MSAESISVGSPVVVPSETSDAVAVAGVDPPQAPRSAPMPIADAVARILHF
jgi:hypothetical protein